LIENYLIAVDLRETVLRFLAASEPTRDPKLEMTREALIRSLDRALKQPAEARNREVSYLWSQFHRAYTETYIAAHDGVLRAHDLQEKFDEILRTDIWWEFRHLSQIAGLKTPEWQSSTELIRRLSSLDCSFDVRNALTESPSCFCQLRMADAEKWHKMPDALWSEISKGQVAVRDAIRARSREILDEIETVLADKRAGDDQVTAARELRELLRAGADIPRLNLAKIELLRNLFDAAAQESTSDEHGDTKWAERDSPPADPADLFESSDELLLVEV
jgi:hypothetical protein